MVSPLATTIARVAALDQFLVAEAGPLEVGWFRADALVDPDSALLEEGLAFVKAAGSPLRNRDTGYVTLECKGHRETFRTRSGCCLYYRIEPGNNCSTVLTTFLDIGHQLEVLDLVRQLNQERAMTIVLVLHDLNQAARYSHRMVVLQQGQIVADGPPTGVLTPELLEQVFGVRANIVTDPASGTPVCLPYAVVPEL